MNDLIFIRVKLLSVNKYKELKHFFPPKLILITLNNMIERKKELEITLFLIY